MNAIGKNIKKIRKDRRLTQKQLAERCNLAEITIRQYEAGKYMPKIGSLQKITNALHVPISEVYGWDNSEENNLNDNKTKFGASQIMVAKSILENAIDSDSYLVMHKAIMECYKILKELCDLSSEVR